MHESIPLSLIAYIVAHFLVHLSLSEVVFSLHLIFKGVWMYASTSNILFTWTEQFVWSSAACIYIVRINVWTDARNRKICVCACVCMCFFLMKRISRAFWMRDFLKLHFTIERVKQRMACFQITLYGFYVCFANHTWLNRAQWWLYV